MDEIGPRETVTSQSVVSRALRVGADLSALADIAGEFDGVEMALHRIDKGSYGQCTTCGGHIGIETLDAEPLRQVCAKHP